MAATVIELRAGGPGDRGAGDRAAIFERSSMLCDSSGRTIRYLRLSLTPACQMRCVYCCGAAATMTPPLRAEGEDRGSLTADEIVALVSHLVSQHGLSKVRLTGGDPTARGDLVAIIRRLAKMPGLTDRAMTTNGLALAGVPNRDDSRLGAPTNAAAYAAAGLGRVNVSLDSLDPARFQRITGLDGGRLPEVLAGLEAAVAAGLAPVKINTVVLAGENDGELPDLVQFASRLGLEIRFIELMPMGLPPGEWSRRFVPESDMRRRLDSVVQSWGETGIGQQESGIAGNRVEGRVSSVELKNSISLDNTRNSTLDTRHCSPARRYRVRLRDGAAATIGFIAAMSRPFCAGCNRLRIAADGSVLACLMDAAAVGGSLLPALRPAFAPDEVDQILASAVAGKPPGHAAVELLPTGRASMIRIGG